MRRSTLRWILAGTAVIALLAAGRLLPLADWLADFGAWIAGLGGVGLVLYAAAHAGVTVLMLPAVLMSIGAGFLFGPYVGALVALAGGTVGAMAAFLIARYVARDRIAASAARDPRFAALDRAIGQKGWRIVFLLRMSAVVPFVLSNYVYGLTAIRFGSYVLASALGLIPLTVLWVGLGAAARRAGQSELAAEAAPLPEAWAIAVLAAGLFITAGVTIYVAKLTRGILRNETTE